MHPCIYMHGSLSHSLSLFLSLSLQARAHLFSQFSKAPLIVDILQMNQHMKNAPKSFASSNSFAGFRARIFVCK